MSSNTCACGGAPAPDVSYHLHRLHSELESTRREHANACQNYRNEIGRLQERCSELQSENMLHKARVANAVQKYLQQHAEGGATSISVDALMLFFGRLANNGVNPPPAPGAKKRGRDYDDEGMDGVAHYSKRAAVFPTRSASQCSAGMGFPHGSSQHIISATGTG
jgi:hypothetical protein